MERIQRILCHPGFQRYQREIKEWEEERPYCGHDVPHLLDVARIAYILALEEGSRVSRELIYAAALLHDIGRPRQYADKMPHEKASVQEAEGILPDCGFEDEETRMILSAIGNHRDAAAAADQELDWLIYRADKRSRSCYVCDVRKECNWSDTKKNQVLTY